MADIWFRPEARVLYVVWSPRREVCVGFFNYDHAAYARGDDTTVCGRASATARHFREAYYRGDGVLPMDAMPVLVRPK